jgi:hypothetical protein
LQSSQKGKIKWIQDNLWKIFRQNKLPALQQKESPFLKKLKFSM